MKTCIALASLVSLALGSNRCKWYDWKEDDWPAPDGEQNFRPLMPISVDQYLNETDFAEGGRFAGQSWEDVYFSDPDYYYPLGFRRAKIMPFNEEFPCFNVTGAGGHKVELMIYTIQDQASIAVSDISVDGIYKQESGVVESSSAQKSYNCFTANTSVVSMLHVAAYCEENCGESETDILWRFRRSKLTWTSARNTSSGNVDMWCNMIASKIVWPSDLNAGNPSGVNEGSNENLEDSAFSMTIIVAAFASLIATLLN